MSYSYIPEKEQHKITINFDDHMDGVTPKFGNMGYHVNYLTSDKIYLYKPKNFDVVRDIGHFIYKINRSEIWEKDECTVFPYLPSSMRLRNDLDGEYHCATNIKYISIDIKIPKCDKCETYTVTISYGLLSPHKLVKITCGCEPHNCRTPPPKNTFDWFAPRNNS